MEENKSSQVADLRNGSLEELRMQYSKLFPGQKIPNNKVFLFRKIAYRMQELEFGEMSEEAQTKLEELIQKFDPVNNTFLRPENDRANASKKDSPPPDRRLPIPGSFITKTYKGQKIQVKVLEDGFEYNGQIYRSLSGIATAICGVHWNGYAFFGL